MRVKDSRHSGLSVRLCKLCGWVTESSLEIRTIMASPCPCASTYMGVYGIAPGAGVTSQIRQPTAQPALTVVRKRLPSRTHSLRECLQATGQWGERHAPAWIPTSNAQSRSAPCCVPPHLTNGSARPPNQFVRGTLTASTTWQRHASKLLTGKQVLLQSAGSASPQQSIPGATLMHTSTGQRTCTSSKPSGGCVGMQDHQSTWLAMGIDGGNGAVHMHEVQCWWHTCRAAVDGGTPGSGICTL